MIYRAMAAEEDPTDAVICCRAIGHDLRVALYLILQDAHHEAMMQRICNAYSDRFAGHSGS